MIKILSMMALAPVLAFGALTEAGAWERNATVEGPRGTNTFSAGGSCSGGTCTRDATGTGAKGNTATRQGTRSCANGSCERNRTTTGPRGKTVTRNGAFSR